MKCFFCKTTLLPDEYWQSVCHECAVTLPDDRRPDDDLLPTAVGPDDGKGAIGI